MMRMIEAIGRLADLYFLHNPENNIVDQVLIVLSQGALRGFQPVLPSCRLTSHNRRSD